MHWHSNQKIKKYHSLIESRQTQNTKNVNNVKHVKQTRDDKNNTKHDEQSYMRRKRVEENVQTPDLVNLNARG